MLIAEYDYDVDIEVQREEASKLAFAQGVERGIERGIEQGIEQGIERGLADGLHQKALEAASNLKRLGIAIDVIAQATGLSVEDVAML